MPLLVAALGLLACGAPNYRPHCEAICDCKAQGGDESWCGAEIDNCEALYSRNYYLSRDDKCVSQYLAWWRCIEANGVCEEIDCPNCEEGYDPGYQYLTADGACLEENGAWDACCENCETYDDVW